ncbi:MAG: FKBP-type peptidyl-prolyl cis-trans isomerase [Xanthomonadales bacterium]|nr:FKBP-type peptidyl-prolyl cis-trans isomerase [Xanthomonadales bacterium]
MRSTLALTILIMLVSGSVLAQGVETDKDKLSYAVGWDIGADIKRRSTEFNVESLITAIRDAVAENDPKVSVEEMRTLLTDLQEKVRAEQVEQFRKLSEENQAKSEAFLEANKSKTGIVVLPSGVQYRIIEEGEGPRPGLESKVSVHYRGSKMDGHEFDSSFARGTPEEFNVNAVLPGWQEVLPLMKAGSTWQVFLPPELAFGARGNPPVGPNEALMFDLKLIEILPQ